MENQSVTILIVDDQEVVRTLVTRMLRGAGYTVLAADDGPGAIALCESIEGLIDIVLIDYSLPSMKGPDVVECLRLTHPELKVVLMSGYPESYTRDDSGLSQGQAYSGFLSKPFTHARLLDTIRGAASCTEGSEPMPAVERLLQLARSGVIATGDAGGSRSIGR